MKCSLCSHEIVIHADIVITALIRRPERRESRFLCRIHHRAHTNTRSIRWRGRVRLKGNDEAANSHEHRRDAHKQFVQGFPIDHDTEPVRNRQCFTPVDEQIQTRKHSHEKPNALACVHSFESC